MNRLLIDSPHRRLNPLTGEWVLVSPHRMERPWQGQVEKIPHINLPVYDPLCYLCPGNKRAGSAKNPSYTSTFVFTNDFPAILPDTPPAEYSTHPLLNAHSVTGTSRVVCFSPRHDLTLSKMKISEIRQVVDIWSDQLIELGQSYRWVQVFENKGAVMGCSNPHPHGQIWASDQLPNEAAKEDKQQKIYYEEHGRTLLVDYAEVEKELEERIVLSNDHWMAVVPFWAVWPYETLLIPHRQISHLSDLTGDQQDALVKILKLLLIKYDNLFATSFPYSMGWHGAPFNDDKNDHWQLHAHFYPPLLRSATVKKFLVGYEMLAEAQRDLTAEQAAYKLRDLGDIHYSEFIRQE